MGSPRKLRMWKLSRIRWFCRLHLRRLKSIFKEKLNIVKIFFLSLCYNDFLDKYYVADTAMEPMFWFVDHFTKFFGPLFVFAVCSLILTGVLIIYLIGIPYWWNKDPLVLCILFVIGHWLLVNIVFHYYMAAVTHPGYLPEGILIPEAVSICKKCISPKPPRTHHCSICNKCILKMDHHCPWLNNCIGHYNHRYFFLFMLYMVAGIVFVMVFGYGIVYEHFWEDKVPFSTKESQNNDTLMRKLNRASDDDDQEPYSWTTWLADYHKNMPLIERMKSQYWYHVCIVYLSLLCSGVLVALGALTVWHARLITRGETSIEAHINKNETKRLKLEKKFYINPYNFGASDNWKIFLGIQNGRTWRHVIFPSWHKPEGNGLQWRIAY